MPDNHDRIIGEAMEQLIAEGPSGMAGVFTRLFNLAMRFERETFLGAGLSGILCEGSQWSPLSGLGVTHEHTKRADRRTVGRP